jgi:hypothetical protein
MSPIRVPDVVLGIIVAELNANAVRHAFGLQDAGTIQIECRTSGARMECRVSDNGSLSSANVRPGSGLGIIETLAPALGVSVQFDFAESGTEATLLVPIEQGRCDGLASTRHGVATLAYGSSWRFELACWRLTPLVLSIPLEQGGYTAAA